MARTNEEATIEEEVRDEFRKLAKKNHKAQALIPYNPDNKEFWAQHSILSHMVDLLKIRGANVGSGEKLRVIMTMQGDSPSLLLQGDEVDKLLALLAATRGAMTDDEAAFVDELIERVS